MGNNKSEVWDIETELFGVSASSTKCSSASGILVLNNIIFICCYKILTKQEKFVEITVEKKLDMITH